MRADLPVRNSTGLALTGRSAFPRESRPLDQPGSCCTPVGAVAERTRLTLPDDLPLDVWCRIGDQIVSVADSSAWWIGDWLVFGQEQYHDRYKHAMKETSLDYQTLRNYAWVARKFEPSRRRDALTFQHHMEVAALSADDQEHWLDFAVRLGWSRNELRKQIRASTAPDEIPDANPEIQLNLRLDKDRLKCWEEAAHKSNQSLMEWMSTVLDRAV
ncbi:LmbU family transcriptional regulator [Streptomyces sp. NPDC014894]|uniref:LmbU family transcriptional regulator n=1 Tax=unclassified Streptomyces TaxID=2593676 RepID=UPI0036F4C619